MTITVQAGFAICGSCLKLEEVARTLAVQASDANYDRIDSVVLRLNTNDNARYCDLYVVQGIPSTSPVRPTLTRTSTIWELGLADIFIAKNSGAISAARITDTRYDATRCGVISSISEFDTTTIYNQVQADLAEFKAEEQADFLAWYEQMRNQLSEDVAGNLQAQIDAMKGSILDTMEEINANTQDNQLAGANAVKELEELLKAYHAQLASMNAHCTDALRVDFDNPNGAYNKPCTVHKDSAIDCPPDFYFGIREVMWVMKSHVIVRLTGLCIDNYECKTTRVWTNTYYEGVWRGWEAGVVSDDLANYLPLSGGTLSGSLSTYTSEAKAMRNYVGNVSRTIAMEVHSNGYAGLFDHTKNDWLIFTEGTLVRITQYLVLSNYIQQNLYDNQLTIGSQNETYCHFMSSKQPFYFNQKIYSEYGKVLTADDFVVTGSANEATLTINLD